jgi:hypothetical protein
MGHTGWRYTVLVGHVVGFSNGHNTEHIGDAAVVARSLYWRCDTGAGGPGYRVPFWFYSAHAGTNLMERFSI